MVKKYTYITAIDNNSFDESNHGNLVASLIAGKQGIGMIDKEFQFTIYQDTPGNMLDLVEVICEENQDPEGITIINLSMSVLISLKLRLLGEKY